MTEFNFFVFFSFPKAGILLFLLGIFRFGFLDNILSQPLLAGLSIFLSATFTLTRFFVLLGFINAVAITVFIEQLGPFLGTTRIDPIHEWDKLPEIWNSLGRKNLITFLLGRPTTKIWA